MNIDRNVVKAQRLKRAWSQEQLAAAAGLSLRTVQRIEKSGVASSESVKSLAAAFNISIEECSRPAHRELRKWASAPARAALGFVGGAAAGLALTVAGTASAVDYKVQSYLNDHPIAVRKEARGELRAVTMPVLDANSREQARVRIVVSELDNGNVRFDLVLYDCDANGCASVSTPAMETRYNVPARVEWSTLTGQRVAFELTPSE